MTGPTEQEIRESFRLRADQWPTDNPWQKLREAVEDFGDFMHGPAYAVLESVDPLDPDQPDEPGDIWSRDLRATEAKALDFYYREAVDQALSDARAAIERVFVAEAMRFVAEFPDAPRAVVGPREPVPA